MKAVFIIFLSCLSSSLLAQADPSGAPGLPNRWPQAAKQAIGTAYEPSGANSPVWFTLAQGILSEVYYPSVDQPQTGDLQFVVTDGDGFFSDQKTDTQSTVSYDGEGMSVHIAGSDKSGRYAFEQRIVTDPSAPVVRIRTSLHWNTWVNTPGLRVFVLFHPAVGEIAGQNLATAETDGLFATSGPASPGDARGGEVVAALIPSIPFRATGSGYVGFSDGLQDLARNFELTETSSEAGPGNVELTGEIPVGPGDDFTYELALSFGSTREAAQTYAQTSLAVPFEQILRSYENGWKDYVNELQAALPATRFVAESLFARRSAQLIKMHEDKLNRGAIVASLSKPAIPGEENAPDGIGGYHFVRPRDLYHAAMGLLAAGDGQTPVDVLRYLEKNQRAEGFWPGSLWVDGETYGQGMQLDETAFPILLASQLKSRGAIRLGKSDLNMIHQASSFIMSHGPTTPEDRWGEARGYVPSTLADAIAALKTATALTGDWAPATVANQWQALIEHWTLVSNGVFGMNYYLMASPDGEPGTAEQILDGGFLELVRMGIRQPNDPRILNTLRAYENPTSGLMQADAEAPKAMIYRRYSRDAYGDNHVGGFWPLLAGEKGDYDVIADDADGAEAQLYILEKSASPSGMLPEQLDAPSADSGATPPPGVACPLVWAHAEDILLHRGIEEGKIFDAPAAQ